MRSGVRGVKEREIEKGPRATTSGIGSREDGDAEEVDGWKSEMKKELSDFDRGPVSTVSNEREHPARSIEEENLVEEKRVLFDHDYTPEVQHLRKDVCPNVESTSG